MILYEYKCKACGEVFERTKAIKDRSSHPCPVCGADSKKTMGASKVDALFKPGWFNNIAPVPVYLENREQFTNVAGMMGNYANRPFCKQDSGNIRQPRTPKEKREVIRKLKRGEY